MNLPCLIGFQTEQSRFTPSKISFLAALQIPERHLYNLLIINSQRIFLLVGIDLAIRVVCQIGLT